MEEQHAEEQMIDFHKVIDVAKRHRRRLMALVAATTLFALIIAFTLPLTYESTVLVRTKKQTPGSGISMQASAAMAFLGGNLSTPTDTYIAMLQSRSVLEPVMGQVDMPEWERERMQIKDFIKKYLKITNPKKTELIEIAATGRSPEEAQQIAGMVIRSFQTELTRIIQTDQSVMGKFLKNRVTLAKTELEQAEQKMLEFRKAEKIYAPDEQAKAFVTKMIGYDQQIAQYQVEIEKNQARLQAVYDQIGQQNAAIEKYNLADHATIAKFRAKIVEKNLELFSMEQLYTAKHPGVIRLKEEIAELEAKLKKEVSTLVNAGTSVLNPVHKVLLEDKTKTEVGLYVAQASFDGLKKLQAENEAEIKKLSDKGVQYVSLERQLRVANEVYGVLVRQYEENRIKEAMESMDIQIVDEPNLPKRKSGPQRALITAVGGVLGGMMAGMYVIWLYMRRRELDFN